MRRCLPATNPSHLERRQSSVGAKLDCGARRSLGQCGLADNTGKSHVRATINWIGHHTRTVVHRCIWVVIASICIGDTHEEKSHEPSSVVASSS